MSIAETNTGDAAGEVKIVRDATCTFCGCVCDDIDLTVKDNQIVEAKRACILGKAWFFNHENDDRPACLIEGEKASVEDGVERSAKILCEAKYPIIYGLSDTTSEAQRVAVGIADWIGGIIDTTTSVCHGPSGIAFQGVGEVTCSLGEVANRGDFIMFWGSNPAESHPRHFTKYSLMPKGMFVPRGRKDRTCVIVDVRKTKSANAADIFIQVKPRSDFEALLALTRDMNDYTRFVCKPNRGHGNVTGADNVVAWRTGFPFGVNLARGYPRFNPGEYTTADVLARGEADAAMIIASDPMGNFSQKAREHLGSIPFIAFDPKETPTTRAATVVFNTATYGINTPGTVYRMDDVPIPLRPAFPSPNPSDYDVLKALETRVKQLKGVDA